jgi:hypothetical protein
MAVERNPMSSASTVVPPFGVNLVGFASANLGHGLALRHTASLLEDLGIPFRVLDIDPGGHRTGHDLSLGPRFLRAGEMPPHPVNFFHLNPPGLEGLFRDLPGLVPTYGRMNVSVLYWELARIPLSWQPPLQAMDVILAPTRFIEEQVRDAVPGKPCLYYRQGFRLPESRSDRERWGFESGRVVFLFAFDIASGIHRKHPMGVMEAFRLAFPGGRDQEGGKPILVLKINNRGLSPESAVMADRIRDAAARVPGMRVMDQVMPYRDLLSLYSSMDVLVSLHRGEGLGLSLMEAMALGKPVIATGWSGNMDFMDASNSCPVPYTLVPVEPGIQYHALSTGVDQVWAEPDIRAAADWMARLAVSPELRAEIGKRASAAMRAYIGEAWEGKAISQLRSRWKTSFASSGKEE